ncbi:hypothetical protein AVEN_233382-1 [Araneus ventricosus]|uniref:Uncharacterized protein n=1 Tax=Araneus ventricosus TaxID=182803 RepID=A0A4Y2ML45_ARAVE|nr:hypothetical protein AVEN_233382-1 [Araneus ventricosus]
MDAIHFRIFENRLDGIYVNLQFDDVPRLNIQGYTMLRDMLFSQSSTDIVESIGSTLLFYKDISVNFMEDHPRRTTKKMESERVRGFASRNESFAHKSSMGASGMSEELREKMLSHFTAGLKPTVGQLDNGITELVNTNRKN